MRSGISALFVFVVLIIAFSAFIRYPDKTVAEGIITTETPPIEILSMVEGRVEQLFTKNKAFIKKNDPIAYISNDASLDDINELKQSLEKIRGGENTVNGTEILLPELKQLGMMQEAYAQLRQKYAALMLLYSQSNIQSIQKNTLKHEANKTKDLTQVLRNEKEIFKEELDLKQKDYQRQLSLKQKLSLIHI